MSRYYFHLKDGRTILDAEGVELSSLIEARKTAITNSGEVLRDGADQCLWAGEPWKMWVTDAPNGEGNVLFTLNFSAS
jgi:hypothetical protein